MLHPDRRPRIHALRGGVDRAGSPQPVSRLTPRLRAGAPGWACSRGEWPGNDTWAQLGSRHGVMPPVLRQLRHTPAARPAWSWKPSWSRSPQSERGSACWPWLMQAGSEDLRSWRQRNTLALHDPSAGLPRQLAETFAIRPGQLQPQTPAQIGLFLRLQMLCRLRHGVLWQQARSRA